MSSIVVSGYYGFKNAGDEAMLSAMIEVMTDLEPDIKITVISANPADTKERHGVDSVYWLNYFQIANAIRKSDLLISGGGSLLQNVTSDKSLYYYLSILMLAKMLGTKVMLYAQGIGPIMGGFARKVMHYIGNMADLITVRDSGSLIELEKLGINRDNVHLTADPVMAIHQVDLQIGRSILRRFRMEGAKPLVGISVREWRGWQHYKDILAEVTARIQDELDARVVYLPMQFPEDVAAAEKIIERTDSKAVILNDEYTTSELLSLVGNLDLLIGVRLHALIFAGVMNVPMVGISYDPKIDRYLTSVGEQIAGNLENITADELMNCVRKKWQQRDDVSSKAEEALFMGLRRSAFYNAELAMQLISKH